MSSGTGSMRPPAQSAPHPCLSSSSKALFVEQLWYPLTSVHKDTLTAEKKPSWVKIYHHYCHFTFPPHPHPRWRWGSQVMIFIHDYQLCKEIFSRSEFVDRPDWITFNFRESPALGEYHTQEWHSTWCMCVGINLSLWKYQTLKYWL